MFYDVEDARVASVTTPRVVRGTTKNVRLSHAVNGNVGKLNLSSDRRHRFHVGYLERAEPVALSEIVKSELIFDIDGSQFRNIIVRLKAPNQK